MDDYIKISESEFQYLQKIIKRNNIEITGIKEKAFFGKKEIYIPKEALSNKKIDIYDDVELIYISEIINKTNLSEIQFSNRISYNNNLYELIKNNNKIKYVFTNAYPSPNFIDFVENYDLEKYNIKNVSRYFNYSSRSGYWSLSNYNVKNGVRIIPKTIKYLKLEGVSLGEHILSKSNLNIPNLESIECINCPNIMGIDYDYNIKDIAYYGSQVIDQNFIYRIFNSLCDEEFKCELKLDSLIYFDLIKMYNTLKDEEKRKIFCNNLKNVMWCESIGAGKTHSIEHSTITIASMYNWIKNFEQKYINKDDNDFKKIAILYRYIGKNKNYDNGAIEGPHSSLKHSENGIVLGKIGGTNSFINGLVFDEFVCQGYTSFMKLALRYFKIPCYDILCTAEAENDKSKSTFNHSMQEYIINGKTYFSDLTWSSGKDREEDFCKYFFSSVNDLEKTRSFMSQKIFNLPDDCLSYQTKVELFKVADDRLSNPQKISNSVSVYKESLIDYVINNNALESVIIDKIEELIITGEINFQESQELKSYFQKLYIVFRNVKELTTQYNVLEKDQLIDMILDKLNFNITLDNRLSNYIYKIYITQMSNNLNNLLKDHHNDEKKSK